MKINKSSKFTVGWTPYTSTQTQNLMKHSWPDTVFFEPEPVAPLIVSRDTHYTKCPAIADYYRNTFLIRSPFDLTINFDRATESVGTDRFDNEFFFEYIQPRFGDFGPNSRSMLTVRAEYLFVADEDCVIESMPCSLMSTPLLQNTLLIPGTFNFHRWPRPVDFSFEIIDDTQPLVFKRGDPLFFVKFTPKNGGNVQMKRIDITPTLRRVTDSVRSSRDIVPGKNLAYRYEMAKHILFGRKWLD
jgi:hypothetical protein